MPFQIITRALVLSLWPDMRLRDMPLLLTIGFGFRRDLARINERAMFWLLIEARVRKPDRYVDGKPVPVPWWRKIEVHVTSDVFEILSREAPEALA